MIDYIKKYDAIDANDIKKEAAKMESLLTAGLYPSKFDMPLTLQFELTSRCNVYCKHCYNDSGNNNSEDAMSPEIGRASCRERV